jgi:dynein heavy chain
VPESGGRPAATKVPEVARKIRFPALITCCNINWVLPWPQDALYLVANLYLDELKYANMTGPLKESLVNIFVRTQESLEGAKMRFYNQTKRRVYSTPKSS